ncbi:MAG: flippase-like domain-containing protein [Acidobacteria bacterium]|nr:flippase-like domain-containing protein [Acidobacteriota bacterium]
MCASPTFCWRLLSFFSGYFFRSLRWQQFLRPMQRVNLRNLFSATLIGFSAVALLGRPGEAVRPVLIASKEGLSVSSQAAAWALERALDSLALGTLLGAALLWLPPGANHAELMTTWRRAGVVLWGGALLTTLLLVQLRHRPQWTIGLLDWVLRPLPKRYRKTLHRHLENFSEGLASLEKLSRLAGCAGTSLLVWMAVLLAYWSALQAFGAPLSQLHLAAVVLVMGASAVGSLAQLPGIGGGTQLATALTLTQLFDIPLALATSAAVWLWILSFLLVLIPGLPLAAHEGLNWQRLRRLAKADLETQFAPSILPIENEFDGQIDKQNTG